MMRTGACVPAGEGIVEFGKIEGVVGLGQELRITLQPGTEISNASILFAEPYLFDQPYSNSDELYYRTYVRAGSKAAPQLAPSMNLQIDVDGDGTRDTALVFEPVYVPDQGTVTQEQWQELMDLNWSFRFRRKYQSF